MERNAKKDKRNEEPANNISLEDYFNDAEFAEMSHINEHYIRT